jgi:glycine oxidase
LHLSSRPNSLLYNRNVKNWDAVIIGGGVIGLSLALRLKDQHMSVLIVDKREPACEATHAAGGMIASCDPHIPTALKPLVEVSARIYPEFVREVELESGESADLRDVGAIAVFRDGEIPVCAGVRPLDTQDLMEMEPSLRLEADAWYLPERCVDPRGLGRALVKTARNRSVDFVTGSEILEVLKSNGRASGVRTSHSTYSAAIVINCAGAWAAQIEPIAIPTRPVKGQMVCVVPLAGASHDGPLVQHVVRTPDIYIIPRSDGRILLGATVEEAGFHKQVNPDTIQRLIRAAMQVAPILETTRIHDAWAGLRPGTPDNLPILGETLLRGYFAATGHYRDGIMLAPATADAMAQLITGQPPSIDLAPFSPLRFT